MRFTLRWHSAILISVADNKRMVDSDCKNHGAHGELDQNSYGTINARKAGPFRAQPWHCFCLKSLCPWWAFERIHPASFLQGARPTTRITVAIRIANRAASRLLSVQPTLVFDFLALCEHFRVHALAVASRVSTEFRVTLRHRCLHTQR